MMKQMKRFDVLIVGAGPAGSFAAELLAGGGKRVALFDGRPEGEPKACGGGVTAKALKAWPQLLQAVGRTVAELDLYSPSGKRLHLQLAEPFAIYSRIAFDSYLRERARSAGAEVIAAKISGRAFGKHVDGWQVRSLCGEEFTGRMLVGADGAGSPIARMLAVLKWRWPLVTGRRCLNTRKRRLSLPSCRAGLATPGLFPGWITFRSA